MPRSLWCGLILVPILATAAEAQPNAALVARDGPARAITAPGPRSPDFRISAGDLRETGESPRNGLIGAVGLGDGVVLGVGRFDVPEIARPVFHTERQSRPADVRRRQQGIAALGLSFSF